MKNHRDFEKQLKQANNLAALNQILRRYLEGMQFKYYAFTYYSYYPNTAYEIKYHFASKPYQRWHDYYIAQGYRDIDRTLDYIHRSTLPVYWELSTQLKAAKSERERQMRLDSIAYGIEKGLCIPLHGPNEDFAELLVAQVHGEACLENWQSIQAELFCAAHWYYAYLQRNLLDVQPRSQRHLLSKREKEVLLLVAKKATVAEIANIMAITERTVNYHIQHINKKLGVKNKHQAAAKGLALRIIIL